MTTNVQNDFTNAFGEKNTDKNNIINLNNENNFNEFSDSNSHFSDFYKMIEIEKQKRLVSLFKLI